MQNEADYRSSLVSKPLTGLFCFSVNYLIVRKIQFLLCLAVWNVIGYARKNMQVKFERKSFEMNDVSVFCQVGKMQTATEY